MHTPDNGRLEASVHWAGKICCLRVLPYLPFVRPLHPAENFLLGTRIVAGEAALGDRSNTLMMTIVVRATRMMNIVLKVLVVRGILVVWVMIQIVLTPRMRTHALICLRRGRT